MQYLQNTTNLTMSSVVKILLHLYSTFTENTRIFNVNAVNITNGIVFAICRKCLPVW